MHFTRTSVFLVTLLLGWLFFGWFGDYNMYVVHHDGSRWIKEHAKLSDRISYGFIIALVFSAVQSALLWLCRGLQPRGAVQHTFTTPERGQTKC